jgi:hypothetical protein
MALLKFLLLAVLTIPLTLTPTPANAISPHSHHQVQVRAHDAFVNKKRSVGKRCNTAHPPAKPTTTTAQRVAAAAQPTATHGPAKAGANGNGGRGKVGLAWAADDSYLPNFVTEKVSHVYTWGPTFPPNAPGLGLTPMIMLWGEKQVDQFKQLAVQGYAEYALGPNEPNEKGQSNLTPGQAAALWKTYIQPLKDKGYKLLSPATSSNPNGLKWMQNFMQECEGCTFDGMCVHWYDTTIDKFINYINLWHNTFGLPIWVTEFACQNMNGGPQCSDEYIDQFMSTVTTYMNNADWVANYFAFGLMTDVQSTGVNSADQLMNDNGQPNALGSQYINGN